MRTRCQKCTGRGISDVSAEGRGSVVDQNPFQTSTSAKKQAVLLATVSCRLHLLPHTAQVQLLWLPQREGIRWQREQAQRNCIRCGWAAARIQKLRSGAESQKKQEVSWEKGWESLSVWHTGVFSLPLHVGGGVQVPFSRHLLLPTPSMA